MFSDNKMELDVNDILKIITTTIRRIIIIINIAKL
jgi:hypothetical protein